LSREYAALADDAHCVAAAHLQPAETATSVRVVGGRTLMTDGPFADTCLGGGRGVRVAAQELVHASAIDRLFS
jgi:hypothetical protein